MSATAQPVIPSEVRPGDLADHKSGTLDPRPVASVNHESAMVTLQIGSIETAPVLIDDYKFYRRQGATQ